MIEALMKRIDAYNRKARVYPALIAILPAIWTGRALLEHGSAAPAIAADADLDLAVTKLLEGGFYHAGQVCVSVQRIYAHPSIARVLAGRLADGAGALCVGDPTLVETEVGPLIRTEEFERVGEWVSEAIAAGATALCGGKSLSPSCYAPTVLWNPRKMFACRAKSFAYASTFKRSGGLFAGVLRRWPADMASEGDAKRAR